jgi:hypothetical protein
MADDRVSAALDEIRERSERVRGVMESAGDVPHLLAAIDGALARHKVEPLRAHADNGECGCPVPGEGASADDEIAYDDAHPEGHGPNGCGSVCSELVVGYWCTGCADVAIEHGCFETPKDYPPEKCSVREAVSAALLGEAAATS